MKLAIIGSRSIETLCLDEYIPPETTLIVSGGANGVDRIAEQYADNYKLSKLIIRPEYHESGRAAPIRRNKVIVDEADEILVFWDGVSKGTKSVIDYAKKQGKPIRVYQGSNLILAIPHSP